MGFWAFINEDMPTFARAGRWLFGWKKVKRRAKITLLLLSIPVAAHTILLLFTKWEFSREIGKLRAEGKPVSLVALCGKPVPEEQNAALLYLQARDQLKIVKGPTSIGTTRLSGDTIADYFGDRTPCERKALEPYVRAAVEQNASVFSILSDAVSQSQCAFFGDPEDPIYDRPRYWELAPLYKLVIARAILRGKDGKIDAALDDIALVFKFSNSLDHAIGSEAYSQQWRMLMLASDGLRQVTCVTTLTRAQVARVSQLLATATPTRSHKLLMDQERADVNDWYGYYRSLDGIWFETG